MARYTAQVLGRSRAKSWDGFRSSADTQFYTWLRIPELWPTKVLTFRTPQEMLPFGLRTAEEVSVEVDPQSLYHDGWYWLADLEIIDDRKETGEAGVEPGQEEPGEEGSP